MRNRRLARWMLTTLFVYCLSIGLPALIVPHTFFDDFPFVAHWVERLPPYNEHLVTDVGGLYLGFAVVLEFAAWRLERNLVLAACIGFLVVAVPHFLFHATHLAGFDVLDAIGQIAVLGAILVPPAVAIWATGTAEREVARSG